MLSGAGISAESGVPTFRDDATGLWAKYDPYELSSTDGWQSHPERVWAWYLWRHHLVAQVQPNDGHRAVAAWQDYADVTVITQDALSSTFDGILRALTMAVAGIAAVSLVVAGILDEMCAARTTLSATRR